MLLHRGTISVESKPGKGSTFILQFPIGEKPFEKHIIKDKSADVKLNYIHAMMETFEKNENNLEVTEMEEEKSGDDPDIKKEIILIVEDNNDLRKFIREELEMQYEVLEAENGGKGWELAFKKNPDLIISDIMMPVMSGTELCEKIKNDKNTSHIPIILLTAKTGEENILEGLKNKADDYITKPFNIDILKIKLSNLIETRRLLREKFSKSVSLDPQEYTIAASFDEKFLKKVLKIVENNMLAPDFDNTKFVLLTGYGKTFVYEKIKNLTGLSVSEFIRAIRLKKAAQLLKEGKKNVSQVAYSVGFKEPTHFTRYFNEMFGKNPSQFINKET